MGDDACQGEQFLYGKPESQSIYLGGKKLQGVAHQVEPGVLFTNVTMKIFKWNLEQTYFTFCEMG